MSTFYNNVPEPNTGGEEANEKLVLSVSDYAAKNRELTRTIATLNDKIADLSNQLKEFKASELLSPGEKDTIARIRQEHYKLNEEQNKIAMWLREFKAKEIALGRHAGMSISEVCIMYMGKTVKLEGE